MDTYKQKLSQSTEAILRSAKQELAPKARVLGETDETEGLANQQLLALQDKKMRGNNTPFTVFHIFF